MAMAFPGGTQVTNASPEVEHGHGVPLLGPGHEVVVGALGVGRHPLTHQPPVGHALLCIVNKTAS